MARAWLVDSKVIAKKVKNTTPSSAHQSKEAGVNRECPKCKHCIDNSDVSVEWPGLPAGVKFDPSDLELVEHLAGKVGLGSSKSHPLIDEFIPTLEENEGICYTHPENLPGVKKDGNSIHFFHRTSNAYSTGCRKRRRIQVKQSRSEDHVRWHKTGKTRPIIDNGVQKGCKKIMVLYKSSKKSKPDKTNWVMHQYHLGTEEDEKDGQFVVSKIFYQQQPFQNEKNEALDVEVGTRLNSEETDSPHNRAGPRTPLTQTPDQPKPRTSHPHDECDEDVSPFMLSQNVCFEDVGFHHSSKNDGDKTVSPALLADELPSAAELEGADLDSSLLCNEVLDAFNPLEELGLEQFQYHGDSNLRNDMFGGDSCTFPEIPDLDDIDINNPPDFNLSDLQFGSQDSILSWIGRL